MGSGRSKDATSSPAAAANCSGRRRWRGARVLNYTCFGLPSTLPDDEQNEEYNGRTNGKAGTGGLEHTSTRSNNERCRKSSHHQQEKIPSLTSSDVEVSEYDQDSALRDELGASSSSTVTAIVDRSSNHSERSYSRFGFIPDRIGFRLSRTVSSRSSRAHSFFSDCLTFSNNDGDDLVGIDSSVDNQNETQENGNVRSNSSHDVVIDNTRFESSIDNYSHRSHTESENGEARGSDRQFGPQELLEGSVRFSRTLSVGRLRDRVLRRTSSPAIMFGSAFLEDGPLGYSGQANERQATGGRQRVPSSDRNDEVWPDSSSTHPYRTTNLVDNSYEHELETPHSRDENNHDVHRSAFLERRRRIRSQVRALQRLGSRFENLSGHDRSCILSGQHRLGRCTCRSTNRAVNPSDDTGTRASISRIVMLAEALFEVLDEIHQQSVALSSRPSFSSIGSVPAPKEVVECMPVKVYVNPQKHLNEELAQCYICLVEYEDGDFVRLLPCNHEFHQTCIDKWLKEVHRVCPLCRGDVCRANASCSEKIS